MNFNPFSISRRLTNFFMASFSTRVFSGMESLVGSMMMVVLSESDIIRLF